MPLWAHTANESRRVVDDGAEGDFLLALLHGTVGRYWIEVESGTAARAWFPLSAIIKLEQRPA